MEDCPSVALGPDDAEAVSLDWAATAVAEIAVTVAFDMAVGTEDKEDSVLETAVKADAMADFRAQGILGSTAGTRWDIAGEENGGMRVRKQGRR